MCENEGCEAPRTVSSSVWIVTHGHVLILVFPGLDVLYDTDQKRGLKPGQQEEVTRGTGLRPATAGQEAVNGQNPVLLTYCMITSAFL